MKVVINTCYGGFDLSTEGLALYCLYTGKYSHDVNMIDRCDPALVRVVEELGNKAGGVLSALKIVEVPVLEWFILDNNGVEWVAEKHQTWS